MSSTLLVTSLPEGGVDTVLGTGAEILARYPTALLVRADDAQAGALRAAGLPVTVLADRPVRSAGRTFAFAELAAGAPEQAAGPHLLRLAGPPAPEWLEE